MQRFFIVFRSTPFKSKAKLMIQSLKYSDGYLGVNVKPNNNTSHEWKALRCLLSTFEPLQKLWKTSLNQSYFSIVIVRRNSAIMSVAAANHVTCSKALSFHWSTA